MGLRQLLIDTDQSLFGTTSTERLDVVPQQPNGNIFRQRSFKHAENELFSDPSGPFVVKGLPGVEEETNSKGGLINQVSGNFIRGGVKGVATRVADDFKRLTRFAVTPQGIGWLASNIALQRTNPKTLVSPRNRTFSGINSLGSALLNPVGIHVRRDGFLDVNFESGYNYDPTRGGKKYENTLRTLAINDNEGESSDTLLGVHSRLHDRESFADPSIIKEYGGGAHSVFGIGTTKIKRYKSNPYGGFYKKRGLEYVSGFDISFLTDDRTYGPNSPVSTNLKDFRETKKVNNDGFPLPFTAKTRNRATLYRMGSPGNPRIYQRTPDENGINYGAYNVNTIDQLNAAHIFKRENQAELGKFRDFIKFRIAVVDSENPMSDNVILFRALLDTISDNYSGEWSSYKYNGRPEKFYTYSGFDRQIQFNFKIFAQTRHEMKPLWRKLNYLVAQTSPEYNQLRMRGVFSRLTIGDWMNELPGFFTSVNLSWNSSYPWEIRHDKDGVDADMNEYPHILEVQCSFTPVHNFAPHNSPCDAPFILPEIGVSEGRKWAKLTEAEIALNPEDGLCVRPDEETAFIDETPIVEPEFANEIIPIEDDQNGGLFSGGVPFIDDTFLEEVSVEPELPELPDVDEVKQRFSNPRFL